MSQILEQPVQRLLSMLERKTPRTLIALAGLPGAGKSTLAAQLALDVNAQAGPGTMAALGMDGFHLTRAQLSQMPYPEEALARRGAPWTFDPVGLAQRLEDLRREAGRTTVLWPGFEHGVGDPVEGASSVAPSVRLVLVEGLYLLLPTEEWKTVRAAFDEHWYLDTPLAVALDRLARRHMQTRGLSREDAEARIAHNDGLNAEIVLGTRADADWWVA